MNNLTLDPPENMKMINTVLQPLTNGNLIWLAVSILIEYAPHLPHPFIVRDGDHWVHIEFQDRSSVKES